MCSSSLWICGLPSDPDTVCLDDVICLCLFRKGFAAASCSFGLSISVAVREVVLLSDSSAYESITVWGRDCDSEPQTCDSEPQTVVCVTTVTVRERESELVWQWATDSNMYDSSHSERERERELVWQWATDSNMYDSSHSVRERES